jgi:hypothetical protein
MLSARVMRSVPGAVATGSQGCEVRDSQDDDPVAIAPGTDLMLSLRPLADTLTRICPALQSL